MAVGTPVIVKDARGTGNITQDRRIIDIDNTVHTLDENNNPLVVFTKKAGKKSCFNPEFKWQEDQFEPKSVTVDGTELGAAGTTMTLPAGEENFLVAGDLVIIPGTAGASPNQYDEIVLVTAVDATGLVCTVQRNFGARAAASDPTALGASITSYVLGSAFEEGSAGATARSVKIAIKNNYCEIFKDSFEVTGTEDASDLYGGDDLSRERKKKAMKHMRDIERAFIMGQPKEDTTGSHPRRQTGGLKYFIQSNVTDIASGNINYATFDTFTRTLFRYGDSSTRLFLVGGTLQSVINLMHHNKLQTFQSEEMHGVNVLRIVTGHGDLLVVRHKQFDDMGLGGDGIAVDMDTVKYRFLQGRDTKLKLNIQNNDEDVEKDQYMTECGFEMALEEQSAQLQNVGGFSA